MSRFLPFFAVFAACFALWPTAAANAQDQSPGFSLPPSAIISPDEMEDLSVNFDDAFNAIDNPYLADTIKLNYQISLLEKMAARQSELLKIGESYEALGMKFDEPAPSRGICEQLPPNAPCLKFYPELYPDLIAKRTAFVEAMIAKQNQAQKVEVREGESKEDALARARAEEAARAEEKRKKLAAQERKTRYMWTDIKCLAGQCEGVLIATRAQGYRASVKRGARLPDGTLVREVGKRGITVVIDGDTIAVRPAPAEGEAATLSQAAALAASLGLGPEAVAAVEGGGSTANAASGGAAGATVTAPSVASGNAASGGTAGGSNGGSTAAGGAIVEDGSSGAGGQTMVEPALGPSGLF